MKKLSAIVITFTLFNNDFLQQEKNRTSSYLCWVDGRPCNSSSKEFERKQELKLNL